MPTITFIDADGTRHKVQAENGISLMENAIANNIDGIEAECGGSCMCATCHCFIEQEFAEHTGAVSDDENEMLDCAAVERRPSSRLSCQIQMSDALDGMKVHLPSEQS